jgi:translation initiation factor 3 subunit I
VQRVAISCDSFRPARADDSKLLLTASADQSVRLWDVETGRELFKWPHRGPVKSVAWAEGEREFVACHDPFGSTVPASINVFAFADEKDKQGDTPRLVITDEEAPRRKITRVAWLPLNASILAAYEDGSMRTFDPATGALQGRWQEHSGAITCLAFNAEKTLLVTASSDRTAKLWDVAAMRVLRT